MNWNQWITAVKIIEGSWTKTKLANKPRYAYKYEKECIYYLENSLLKMIIHNLTIEKFNYKSARRDMGYVNTYYVLISTHCLSYAVPYLILPPCKPILSDLSCLLRSNVNCGKVISYRLTKDKAPPPLPPTLNSHTMASRARDSIPWVPLLISWPDENSYNLRFPTPHDNRIHNPM